MTIGVTDRVRAGVVMVHVAGDSRGRGRGAPWRAAQSTSRGAGVVWARDGADHCLVVSNAHVVTGRAVTVVGIDGISREPELLARDTVRDLALLRIGSAPIRWQPVPPATVPVRAGSVVMAVGHPLGVAHAVTSGVVHSVGPLRAVATLPDAARALPWLQLES